MANLGNINPDHLFPEVIKTLTGKFWIVMCYKKNDITYLHNTTDQKVYDTPEQAITASGFSPDLVTNTYT